MPISPLNFLWLIDPHELHIRFLQFLFIRFAFEP